METTGKIARLSGLLAIAVTFGCASAYHDYSECRVNCRYCAPPPLPYTHYDECVCHSCVASRHLSATVPPATEQVAPGNDER